MLNMIITHHNKAITLPPRAAIWHAAIIAASTGDNALIRHADYWLANMGNCEYSVMRPDHSRIGQHYIVAFVSF